MPLTRDFKETVQASAERDPAFREGLLKEGVECLLAGDWDTIEQMARTVRGMIGKPLQYRELVA